MQVVCTFLWDPYYIFDQCCLKSKHLARMLQWMFRQWHYVYIVSLYMIGLEQSLKCWQQIIQTSTRFSFVFWLQNITSLHNTRVAPSHPSLLSPHCCSSDWSGLLISAPCLTISGMSHCVLPLPYIIIHWVLLIGHTPSQPSAMIPVSRTNCILNVNCFISKATVLCLEYIFKSPWRSPVCTMIFSCNLWLPQDIKLKTAQTFWLLVNFEKCCGGMDICFCTFDIKLEDILMKVKSQEGWFPDKSHQWMAWNLIKIHLRRVIWILYQGSIQSVLLAQLQFSTSPLLFF